MNISIIIFRMFHRFIFGMVSMKKKLNCPLKRGTRVIKMNK